MMFVWFTLTSIVKKTASNVMDAAKLRLERNNFWQISFKKKKEEEKKEAEKKKREKEKQK